jgi:transcriptional regulator with XRE-family HTH domain
MAAPADYDPTEFQEVLRAWMDRNGLSQMGAGHLIGISQGVLNRWLKPKGDDYLVKPTPESLKRLEPHLRVPLIQLKRMTDNLSAADLELLNAVQGTKRNNRLESLLSDIRAQWSALEQNAPGELQQAEAVTRAAFRLHHGRSRKPREGRSDDTDISPSRMLLTPA